MDKGGELTQVSGREILDLKAWKTVGVEGRAFQYETPFMVAYTAAVEWSWGGH